MPRPSSRDAILDTAVQIASVQGLEGLSIGGLAKAAGKSKGGICAHFPAKADLQLAVVERAAEIFRRSVVEPALEKRSGFERLEALMEGWFAYIQSEVFRGGCFFTNAALELDDLESTEVLEQVQHLYGAYLQLLEKNIARAAERGEIAADSDPEQLAFELHGLEAAALVRRSLGDSRAYDRATVYARSWLRRIRSTGTWS